MKNMIVESGILYYTRDFEGSRVQSRLPSRQVRRAREGYDPARGEGEGETETSMRGRSLNTTSPLKPINEIILD